MNCGESYVSFLVFLVWAMDPLCGTPCGSASVQPYVEVAEIKSNSQFSEPWISLNPCFPILSQDANILAQDEKSTEARNGRCYYVPRPFFWSDAGTVGPCNDDVGSSILHDFAALIDPSCHSFFHNVCPTVGVLFRCCAGPEGQSNWWRTSRYSNLSLRPSIHPLSDPVKICGRFWQLDMVWSQTNYSFCRFYFEQLLSGNVRNTSIEYGKQSTAKGKPRNAPHLTYWFAPPVYDNRCKSVAWRGNTGRTWESNCGLTAGTWVVMEIYGIIKLSIIDDRCGTVSGQQLPSWISLWTTRFVKPRPGCQDQTKHIQTYCQKMAEIW